MTVGELIDALKQSGAGTAQVKVWDNEWGEYYPVEKVKQIQSDDGVEGAESSWVELMLGR